jgi:RNA 2',3'-cyclic 3'-phosphodiesterase
VRCFIALEVPAEVRAAIARAQQALRAAAPRADMRWADPATIHLTLKFLGAVPAERVAAVSAAIAATVATSPPFDLAVGGLGAFPSPARPRVVWAGISAGGPPLAALAAAVDAAMAPLGFAREARPFRGHLTLGRVRSPADVRPLAHAVDAAGALAFGAWTAREIVLFESRFQPTRALHHALGAHPLGGTTPENM